MKKWQKYNEGRYSSSSSSISKQEEEEMVVISNRRETHEQSDVKKKIENQFGAFKRLKVKGLIKP